MYVCVCFCMYMSVFVCAVEAILLDESDADPGIIQELLQTWIATRSIVVRERIRLRGRQAFAEEEMPQTAAENLEEVIVYIPQAAERIRRRRLKTKKRLGRGGGGEDDMEEGEDANGEGGNVPMMLETMSELAAGTTKENKKLTLGDEHNEVILAGSARRIDVHVYRLSSEPPTDEFFDDDDAEGDASSVEVTREWILPSRMLHGRWDALIYDDGVKRNLLEYASTALFFTQRGVDASLVSWNRVVLLHGPPGTGKTSLCQALAHTLAARLGHVYANGAQLVEVNAHSLFSRWFSESGKLVAKLFARIHDMIEDETTLTFVLLDEVESLTAARGAAVAGAEPSDAVRVVNALLTQIDALRSRPNVMILTTTNITNAVDTAFIDRADIKAYIGLPSEHARYDILRSCIDELCASGVINTMHAGSICDYSDAVTFASASSHDERLQQQQEAVSLSNGAADADASATWRMSRMLREVAAVCEGSSGRFLRKLPFLAHASCATSLADSQSLDFEQLARAMWRTARKEAAMRSFLAMRGATTTPSSPSDAAATAARANVLSSVFDDDDLDDDHDFRPPF